MQLKKNYYQNKNKSWKNKQHKEISKIKLI